jgi:hypothetical protein
MDFMGLSIFCQYIAFAAHQRAEKKVRGKAEKADEFKITEARMCLYVLAAIAGLCLLALSGLFLLSLI